LIEREIQPQKDFLGHILYILRASDQPGDSPQNSLPVSQNDLVKRRAITTLRALDLLEINQHAAPAMPAPDCSLPSAG
jgi:hypothetical protein